MKTDKRYCECADWQKVETTPAHLLDELHMLLKSYPDTCPYCKSPFKKKFREIYVNVATGPGIGYENFTLYNSQSPTNLSNYYVSIGQAARALYVNRATIRRWLHEGKLQGSKIGLVTLIWKQDIIQIARERNIEIGTFGTGE